MFNDRALDERKEKILYAIIDSYLNFAEPAGSRSISKNYKIGVSPATIRNEMSDLEDLGLLTKSHISSGRIPSNKAYRYYVNNILNSYKKNIIIENQNSITKLTNNRYIDFEKIIKSSAKVLASLTDYLVITMMIKPLDIILSHIELLSIGDNDYVLITVYDSGDVNNSVIRFENKLEMEDLKKINFILYNALVGKNISEIDNNRKMIFDKLFKYDKLRKSIDYILKKEMESYNRYDITFEGISKIFDFPEYNDLEKARDFIKFIENKENITQLLSKEDDDYIQVYIGEENEEHLLNDNTLIISNYYLDSHSNGKIAIIGPTRMEYHKTIEAMLKLSWKINNLSNSVL